MYVVLRQADTGDVEALAVFALEDDARYLAALVNRRDNPDETSDPSYVTFVDFVLNDSPRKVFEQLFS